ncbi:hypothetical protein AAX05_08765 [Moraxella bovoculi]|uniref:Uncharacterized protein n=1 Tax=Moraxella bovoculi TaxID=386891 RepID=A0AAC8PUU0_9GAMM|nr:hypothetical protein AAX06_02190 [Moraxella bovoculi]AKG10219.1 hypothetical protein AAX05_08765 [Moraxella bovoculi]AKG12141.1 hypothetical protein AAX07_09310 [Moraxella bovoculi]AKG14110.1 hypothetical protein AAX11_08855 [Moraxella bovoculi]
MRSVLVLVVVVVLVLPQVIITPLICLSSLNTFAPTNTVIFCKINSTLKKIYVVSKAATKIFFDPKGRWG